MKVLIEEIDNSGQLIGRTYNFAPEIDGKTIVNIPTLHASDKLVGKFVESDITFADEYDLYGQFVKALD